MTQTVLPTIVTSGLAVAFFHAAIPTHWLPFVLTGKAQRWNRAKTLTVTALAGGGHVLFTAILGLLLTSVGLALSERIGIWFPRLAGGALLCLGTFYLYRQAAGISHSHLPGKHSDDHCHHAQQSGYGTRMEKLAEAKQPLVATDFFAITSLLALLIFSPCEAFVGFYVVGIRYGWPGFFLLTLVLLVGTVMGMTTFTWLGLAGVQKINLGLLEKYENALIGCLLLVVGVLVVLFEK